MKIVILDGYTENPGDLSWDALGAFGELTIYDRTSRTDTDEIIAHIGDAEIVITNKTPISKAVIDACPAMRYIAVLATGSRPTEEGRSIARYTDLDTLLSSSDVIALHCPLFPETAGMINRDTIARMKDGVILLNTARGGLIVEQDLADALNSGKVAAAGVDSVSSEPIRSDNPLLQAKNCIITPHIAWGSRESRQRIMDCTAENLRAFLSGSPINTVN